MNQARAVGWAMSPVSKSMIDDLVQTLGAAGKSTEMYQSPDGSKVLMLPHGGRILGLFAEHAAENFYWTHPALETAESARKFYESDAWHNSGGDRTWLAPEVDIFFPQFPELDLSTYWQPRQLDPGNYRVVRECGVVRLVNRLTLTLSRSRKQVALEIAKWVGPAPNPLRYEQQWEFPRDVKYAGYTQHTALKSADTSGEITTQIGLWNLVQMPHGGELLVPTYSRSEPKVYMGHIGSDDLVATQQLVRYRMRAKGEHKIGLRGVAMTGRVGYLYSAGGGESALIIRSFFVNPSGEYVDVPWREPSNLGFAIQACNVDSGLGSFSELEYHVPAIGSGTGLTSCEDVSQIWAFRGREESVREIARRLLSPEI
jgi:hypothetical protein